MAKTVELETVEYDLEAMEHVAGRLLYNFAVHTRIEGAEDWINAGIALATNIREQRRDPLILEASGLRAEFRGFPEPIPRIIDERVIYIANNPRFTFRESEGYISPRQRTYNERVTREIMNEMSIVYRLKTKDYPSTLLFPKAEYAKRIDVSPAVQLT